LEHEGDERVMGRMKGNGVGLTLRIEELTTELEVTDISDLAKNEKAIMAIGKLVRMGEGVLESVDEVKEVIEK